MAMSERTGARVYGCLLALFSGLIVWLAVLAMRYGQLFGLVD
jgi:hypothetical protein